MNVLVVAAHPDDEVLGCGGTIARHTQNGDEVSVIFMSDGETSRPGSTTSDIQKRLEQAYAAAEILGIKNIFKLSFNDNKMDQVALLTIVQALEKTIKPLSPEIVYTHHAGDLNIDHSLTHRAVLTACRPVPGSTIKKLVSFEVPSSTEWSSPHSEPFMPNYFIDISQQLDIKLKALNVYTDEIKNYPHPRSRQQLKYLAHLRGGSVGVEAAEAFMLIRSIL